ncbi:Hypothetical predicted protein [Podarcis lilfordi]|uniref:Uncharacterized protein n=2 Tax=Podarcis lilfordi TaxID=74358 RepID=A0AA35PG71_9SAUR|nr:Hypothetical predicted protein [Podarcis lilfordi]
MDQDFPKQASVRERERERESERTRSYSSIRRSWQLGVASDHPSSSAQPANGGAPRSGRGAFEGSVGETRWRRLALRRLLRWFIQHITASVIYQSICYGFRCHFAKDFLLGLDGQTFGIEDICCHWKKRSRC